jgi:hypothetical protein
LTAEDRIHIALVLALGVANLAILVHGPCAGPLPPAEAARLAVSEPPSEVQRAEIDAAIQQLELWLAPSRAQAVPELEQQLALQGLGPTPDDRTHPERWLGRLLGAESTRSWLSLHPSAAASADATRPTLTAALVILLESGVPLEQQIAAAPAEKAPGLKLSELVQRSLEGTVVSPDEGADSDPWQLDLLSLAVLGGLEPYRERLAQATQRALRRLDRVQRGQSVQLGSGPLDAGQLARWASEWRAPHGAEWHAPLDLHCSAAVFRATAVLGDDDLDTQARRHLHALLSRYPNDRALYRYLEATARNERERSSVRVEAIEHLGRFEEALYNAHLTFRSNTSSAPAPYTAQVMRLAARDLIDRLQSLHSRDFEPTPSDASERRRELLRAAVHALRGLRTARVAG